MEMLERMQRVWPSAWRAKELIHGSKVQALKETAHDSPERTKRVAESSADDLPSDSRATNGVVYRQSQPVYGEGGPAGPQPGYPINLDLQHAESPTYYQYSRWASEGGGIGSMSGSLSTSVLPQTYSTGLVDERLQRHPDRQGRYPAYWNDYSSLGQMDPTYAMPVMNELVSEHPDDAQPGQSLYMPDQYSIYSASAVF